MHTPWHTTAVSAAFGNLAPEIAVVIAILGRGFLKFKSCVKRTSMDALGWRRAGQLVAASVRAFWGAAHHAPPWDLIGVYSTIQSSLLLLPLYEQP